MFAIFYHEIKIVFKASYNAQRHNQSFDDSQLPMKSKHSILILSISRSDKEGAGKEELHSDLDKSVMSALASDKLIAVADCTAHSESYLENLNEKSSLVHHRNDSWYISSHIKQS